MVPVKHLGCASCCTCGVLVVAVFCAGDAKKGSCCLASPPFVSVPGRRRQGGKVMVFLRLR